MKYNLFIHLASWELTVTGGEEVDVPKTNDGSLGIIFLATLPCPLMASAPLFLLGVSSSELTADRNMPDQCVNNIMTTVCLQG